MRNPSVALLELFVLTIFCYFIYSVLNNCLILEGTSSLLFK